MDREQTIAVRERVVRHMAYHVDAMERKLRWRLAILIVTTFCGLSLVLTLSTRGLVPFLAGAAVFGGVMMLLLWSLARQIRLLKIARRAQAKAIAVLAFIMAHAGKGDEKA